MLAIALLLAQMRKIEEVCVDPVWYAQHTEDSKKKEGKPMFQPKSAFSGFSVNDLARAKAFYTETLGLRVDEEGAGLVLHLPGGGSVLAYPKDNHQPATYTMLDFVVANIDEAVEDLQSRGVRFERYAGIPQDEKGVMRGLAHNMGPDIAWFLDPAGNILAVLQQEAAAH
jgi:catechol 2,3-dioxygenase-like lactoylglutathione lyase family enzyme